MSINDSIATCDTQSWLRVASLVLRLVESGHSGQSSLVKMDGLRVRRGMYTVLIDGGPDSEPAFREDSAELCPALERALSGISLSVESNSADGTGPGVIADLLEGLNSFARAGAVVSVRVDHARAPEFLQVHVGSGNAYFHVEGSELQPLLEEAIVFAESLQGST